MKKSGIRRQARELALQVLFQQEFAPGIDIETGLNTFRGNFEAPLEVWDYASLLLRGVNQYKEHIDSLIQKASAHWSLQRMALVDLILMRLCTYEIIYAQDNVPQPAAINEALEVAKKYGSTDSSAFINGILDQIAKTSSRE